MINLAAPDLGTEEKRRLIQLIDTTSQLTRGPAAKAFESEFAAFCNARHGIATSNGTTALHTALAALELGQGDRVATSPLRQTTSTGCFSLLNSIHRYLE